MTKKPRTPPEPAIPPSHDWRTSDEDEIVRRKLRARDESFAIANLDSSHPIFSDFSVSSVTGRTYRVEIRDVHTRQFACECVDFFANGLGTCKHIEAVLIHLDARFRRLLKLATESGPSRAELVPDRTHATLRLGGKVDAAPRWVRDRFGVEGLLRTGSPEELLERMHQRGDTGIRISQEIGPWLEARQQAAESRALRHEYEQRVQRGEWPVQETLSPLFPYQREGMLHLAFTERALLADEMGLGKTIQAIAACALLHRLGKAQRVLIVTPASLKSEWEEQIKRFTTLPCQLVFGGRHARLAHYSEEAPFFTITNFEQMVRDALDVNEHLRPDIVVLDEAQRIKNWNTKTSQAVKRLRSRYAFVLTGTPIENRIDELHSLMDFLNPAVLGPLFRFNREYYALDERGKPEGYRNLDVLRDRIRPFLLRRRKAEVETELPARTDRNHFVPLSPTQKQEYAAHEQQVSKLVHAAMRRPLSPREQDKLMRELAMLRMICDTVYILNPDDRACPKLEELEKVLEECGATPGVKVIVFSEWERMLELVRGVCEHLGLGFAWHTGSVPQQRRRGEINRFKDDPECRVFLSTDAGATGLNLQNASVVINCDLPWNPAKLEQRIARAWRKNQVRPVTVINLVSENTIEHRMLATLADKAALASGVLDNNGNLTEIKLRGGRQAMLARLEQLMSPAAKRLVGTPARVFPADRPRGFAAEAATLLGRALLRCEEHYPREGTHTVVFVVLEGDAALHRGQLEQLHAEYFAAADPLAPVQLQVLDRATHEAIERMIAAGLLASATSSRRTLLPAAIDAVTSALTPEEEANIVSLRDQCARKRKLACLLGESGFPEESRAPMLDAIHLHARALAATHRLPEPEDAVAALRPPLSHYYNGNLAPLRSYLADAASGWQEAAEALSG